ncbi:NTP transferase domain-containing protein [Thermopetrobacter sp. TC1]|uniref:phosphocholine cytidylyltransferase family protein n=1 Tax=Thermopetrobacter sp. TC1 TaxID=1495045 RepID=UPI00068BF136|nr:phosphocholine cytidylyltransferase family protein [Thermopetrobacter sp. TC1]
MKVIILAAGQGRRLLPLTAEVPKALLDIGGQTLIGRQIDAFAACGIKEFVVVTGFASDKMEEALERIASRDRVTIRTVYNPFYAVSDNLASCWMARHEMDGDFIQVNGDNVFRSDLVEALLAANGHDVLVAINRKEAYDEDDMKVMLDGDRLTEIGKTLPLEAVDAEATGFYVFRKEGPALYRQTLEEMMREPSALHQWFPAAIGRLAKRIPVGVVDLTGHVWCEVDFPSDLTQARRLAAEWDAERAERRRPRLISP